MLEIAPNPKIFGVPVWMEQSGFVDGFIPEKRVFRPGLD